MSKLIWAVLIAGTANWTVIETWHHGSLFDSVRARLEVCRGRFLADLLLCPYCLSHWTAIPLLAASLLMMVDFSQWDWWRYPGLVCCWLVVIRISNLLNDLTRSICRTPGRTVPVSLEDRILAGIAGGAYDPTPRPDTLSAEEGRKDDGENLEGPTPYGSAPAGT